MIEYISIFLKSEIPFTLLFISLFFYVIKRNKEKEEYFQKILESKIDKIEEELNVLIRVWKILLEKELQDYKEEKKK